MRKLTALIFLFISQLLMANENTTTHRVLQFENAFVKVWKTTIMPHQPLNMHRHDCPRVIVGLKGGTLKKIEATGEESALIFETDQAYWLDEDPVDTLHADINESDKPIEVLVIELKPQGIYE